MTVLKEGDAIGTPGRDDRASGTSVENRPCPSDRGEDIQVGAGPVTGTLSDEEFKRRYFARLINRLCYEGMQDRRSAGLFAQDYWEDCPRDEMADKYANDPELAADCSYDQWCCYGDNDDDAEPNDDLTEDEERE